MKGVTFPVDWVEEGVRRGVLLEVVDEAPEVGFVFFFDEDL